MSRENASKPLYLLSSAEQQTHLHDSRRARRTTADRANAAESDRGGRVSATYLPDGEGGAPAVRGNAGTDADRDVSPAASPRYTGRISEQDDTARGLPSRDRDVETVYPNEGRENADPDGDDVQAAAATGLADRVRGNDGGEVEDRAGYTRTVIGTTLSDEDWADRERHREQLKERRQASEDQDRTASAARGHAARVADDCRCSGGEEH